MNLNEQDILNIAKASTRHEALNIIKTCIDYKYTSIMDIYRNEIMFDMLLDILNFCLKKGFTFSECLICVSFLYDALNNIKKATYPNTSLSDSASSLARALDMFAGKLGVISKNMNEHKVKLVMDYLNETLFKHFHLIKYVFTYDRENHMINDERTVICPPKDNFQESKLIDSKTYAIYEYEQKLLDFEKREREIKEKFAIERDRLVREEDMAKNLIEYIQNDAYGSSKPLDDESFKKLIDEVSTPIVDAVKNTIKCEVEELKQTGMIGLEKQALVRPIDTIIMNQSKSSVQTKTTKKGSKR